jgi:hypothetical protein
MDALSLNASPGATAGLGANDGMGSGRWPSDWATGWFSGIWVDSVGNPVTGTVTVALSVTRAASARTKTTIYGGQRVVPIVDGIPTGEFAIENGAGIPCVKFPTTDDPDIQPSDLQLIVTESWSSISYRRELRQNNTLENPLWLTGDTTSIEKTPSVMLTRTWGVEAAPGNIPPEAAIGDLIAYSPSGVVTKRTS